MSGQVTRIDAKELKARLHDGGEIALLDAREELPFGRRHLLMASCVPLSRLELLVDDLVPRRGDARGVVRRRRGPGGARRGADGGARIPGRGAARRRNRGLGGGGLPRLQRRARAQQGLCRSRRARGRHAVDIRRGSAGADRPQGRHRDLRQPVLRGVSQQQHPDGRSACPARSWSIASPTSCRRPTPRSSSIAAAARAASSARSR